MILSLPFRFCLLLSILTVAQSKKITCSAAREECLRVYPSPCNLLPLPKASLPAPVSEKGYDITTIRPGVHWYTDGAYVSLILFKNGRLTVVDFPNSLSPSILRNGTYLLTVATTEILAERRPKRLDMVYGHRHLDHIGGARLFQTYFKRKFPGVQIFIWGTAETRDFLRLTKRPIVPVPNVLVGRNGRTVNLANSLELNLRIIGGHAQEDLAAYVLPSRDGPGLVHLADILRPGVAPFSDFGGTVDLGEYIGAHEKILKLNFKFFSAGHGRLGTKRDVRINLDYTRDAIDAAERASAEVTPQQRKEARLDLFEDPNAAQFGNIQWLFTKIIELEGRPCLRRLIEKWGCVLGAVDVVSPSHCKEVFGFNAVNKQD